MGEHEEFPDRYVSTGEDLVEFLLNHRGLLECSANDFLMCRMLDGMMHDPANAFYFISGALMELSERRSFERERLLKILQYAVQPFTTLDGVIQCQAQPAMEKGAGIGPMPGPSGGGSMESSG